MIKVTVTYPKRPGSRFDKEYYLKVHMPMAARLLGQAAKAVTAEIGVSGMGPGEPPAYVAVAGFVCESVEAFTQAFTPIAAKLEGDIPNYTDIEPVIQISDYTEIPVASA